jgi:hypothetical protein
MVTMAAPAKRRFLILSVIVVMLGSAGFGFYVTNRPKAPRIDLRDGLLLELGEGSQGELLEGKFRLGNSGSSELHFHLNAGCSCTQLQPRDGVLQPGESLSVNVGLRLRNEGKDERVAIRIESNDANLEAIPFWVIGKCPANILVDPALLDFGHIPHARSVSKEIKVEFPKLAGPPLVANLVAGSTDTFITSKVRQRGASELAVVVSLDGSLPIGHHSGVIKLEYEGIDRVLEIPVVVEIVGPIQVAPATIRFSSLQPTDEVEHEVTLLVRSTQGVKLGSPARLDVPPGLRVVRLSDRSSDRCVFRVRRAPQEPLAEGQEIRMRFDGVEEEIRVAVYK